VAVSEFSVFLFVLGLGLFLGFIAGIYFVLAGGVYVNKYGAVDFRWPPRKRRKRL
jgi:hypothetical protein